jgi:hypothetical protein
MQWSRGRESIDGVVAGADCRRMWPGNHTRKSPVASDLCRPMQPSDDAVERHGAAPARSRLSIEFQNVVEFGRCELAARRIGDLDPPSRLEEHACPRHRERRAGHLHGRGLAVLGGRYREADFSGRDGTGNARRLGDAVENVLWAFGRNGHRRRRNCRCRRRRRLWRLGRHGAGRDRWPTRTTRLR